VAFAAALLSCMSLEYYANPPTEHHSSRSSDRRCNLRRPCETKTGVFENHKHLLYRWNHGLDNILEVREWRIELDRYSKLSRYCNTGYVLGTSSRVLETQQSCKPCSEYIPKPPSSPLAFLSSHQIVGIRGTCSRQPASDQASRDDSLHKYCSANHRKL
jgi:hypothetical protein